MGLSKSELCAVLSYDSTTGIFVWIKSLSNVVKVGSIAGKIGKDGRRDICVARKIYKAHRLAWLYVYGVWPTNVIDHIDGDNGNNRIDNLRDVVQSTNMQNMRKARMDSKSQSLGVHCIKSSGKFRAQLKVDGMTRHIGCFDSKDDAHAAYISAKRLFHEGCTL
jgi:hypothetical protein